METTTTTETTGSESLLVRLDEIWHDLGDQQVVSQARYVDQLLDCFTGTEHGTVRALLREVLAEVSGVTMVETRRVRDHLAWLSAAALID
ncbi:MAG: hypothetical protein AAGD18_17115 [Actinomycetota bacterium]